MYGNPALRRHVSNNGLNGRDLPDQTGMFAIDDGPCRGRSDSEVRQRNGSDLAKTMATLK
jgi:hypothetical protein